MADIEVSTTVSSDPDIVTPGWDMKAMVEIDIEHGPNAWEVQNVKLSWHEAEDLYDQLGKVLHG